VEPIKSSLDLDEWIRLDALGFAFPSLEQLFYLRTMSLPILDGTRADFVQFSGALLGHLFLLDLL
jgi:hypothetical protein